MLVAAVESLVIGAVCAVTALRVHPGRFPSARAVLLTGLVAAPVGGLITRFVLGGAHPAAVVPGALAVAMTGVSLLLAPRAPAPARAAVPAAVRTAGPSTA